MVPPVVGGFLFGDASTMLSASLMRDPVMLLSGMLMLLVAFCLFMAVWKPLRSYLIITPDALRARVDEGRT